MDQTSTKALMHYEIERLRSLSSCKWETRGLTRGILHPQPQPTSCVEVLALYWQLSASNIHANGLKLNRCLEHVLQGEWWLILHQSLVQETPRFVVTGSHMDVWVVFLKSGHGSDIHSCKGRDNSLYHGVVWRAGMRTCLSCLHWHPISLRMNIVTALHPLYNFKYAHDLTRKSTNCPKPCF